MTGLDYVLSETKGFQQKRALVKTWDHRPSICKDHRRCLWRGRYCLVAWSIEVMKGLSWANMTEARGRLLRPLSRVLGLTFLTQCDT